MLRITLGGCGALVCRSNISFKISLWAIKDLRPKNSSFLHLLLCDGSDVAPGADGKQQGPGQESVCMELCGLRIHRRSASIFSNVRVCEEALKTLHSGIHILEATQISSLKSILKALETSTRLSTWKKLLKTCLSLTYKPLWLDPSLTLEPDQSDFRINHSIRFVNQFSGKYWL